MKDLAVKNALDILYNEIQAYELIVAELESTIDFLVKENVNLSNSLKDALDQVEALKSIIEAGN